MKKAPPLRGKPDYCISQQSLEYMRRQDELQRELMRLFKEFRAMYWNEYAASHKAWLHMLLYALYHLISELGPSREVNKLFAIGFESSISYAIMHRAKRP